MCRLQLLRDFVLSSPPLSRGRSVLSALFDLFNIVCMGHMKDRQRIPYDGVFMPFQRLDGNYVLWSYEKCPLSHMWYMWSHVALSSLESPSAYIYRVRDR